MSEVLLKREILGLLLLLFDTLLIFRSVTKRCTNLICITYQYKLMLYLEVGSFISLYLFTFQEEEEQQQQQQQLLLQS